MQIRSVLLFLLMFCGLENSCWATDDMVVGHFSRQPKGAMLPDHWQPLLFAGVDSHTQYLHLVQGGHGVIQATSSQSSSGLVRKIELNPSEYSHLSFSWKIQDIIETADLTQKSGDDAPARVYITFAYDSAKVSFWEVIKFETIKLFYGEYPPIAALTYVWASHVPKGMVLSSPYTNRVKMIVLQSGADKKGQWLVERRDIRADYRLAFDSSDVPLISGVAIMTDTDNTGTQAVAWYGDIVLVR